MHLNFHLQHHRNHINGVLGTEMQLLKLKFCLVFTNHCIAAYFLLIKIWFHTCSFSCKLKVMHNSLRLYGMFLTTKVHCIQLRSVDSPQEVVQRVCVCVRSHKLYTTQYLMTVQLTFYPQGLQCLNENQKNGAVKRSYVVLEVFNWNQKFGITATFLRSTEPK